MNGQPKGRRSARARAAALAAGSLVAAALGATLLAAPANADPLSDTSSCGSATPITDLTGSPSLTGVLQPTVVETTDTLTCAATTVLGSGSDSGSGSTTSHEPVSRAKTPTTGDSTDPSTTGTGTSSASAGGSRTLGTLALNRSSNTVYPVKDGYLDSVRIAVRAIDAGGDAVAVQGTALLTKAGRTLRTWTIAGTDPVISWNGRIRGVIRTGLYTLQVSVGSADGSRRSSSTHIRVLSAHLEKRALVVRSDVGARAVSGDLPRQLLKAYAMGAVRVQVKTVARVTGTARLVFSSADATRYVLVRNGTHTTRPLAVPPGFSHVTITHDWKKGEAHLQSLQAIWSYYTLS